jgi:hypothetical protein
MDWLWLDRADDPDASPGPRRADLGSTSISWRPRLLWASSVAASIAAAVLGGWYLLSPGPIRDVPVAAWTSHRLVPGGDGVSLTAAPGDEDADRSPLVVGGERPLEANPPSQPNIYAPLRVQKQLILQGGPGAGAAGGVIRSVSESVRPGSLFYLEFSTVGSRGEGTAVAIRLIPGPSEAVPQEVPFRPGDGTSYIGPLEVGGGEAEYLVVIADRRDEPLLETVRVALGRGRAPMGDDAALREKIADALERAGHRWYGLQRIKVKPEDARVPPR